MNNPQHINEWLESGIDRELIEYNLVSLSGEEAYEYLLYDDPRLTEEKYQLDRRNDGRVSNGTLDTYAHIEDGGWYCGTLDPASGEDSLWGSFKPDSPRTIIEASKGFGGDGQPKTKVIKYEHPPKKPTEIFLLKIPDTLWQFIGDKLEIYPSCSLNPDGTRPELSQPDFQFWAWVIDNPLIPLTLEEGVKKTACLLSNGYVAIGLPGIYGAYRQPKDALLNPTGCAHLIPQLAPFCTMGREINFCFDNDPKPSTKESVHKAIAKTGKLLKNQKCIVNVVTWDTQDNIHLKGVDDLIVAKGIDYYNTVYNTRQSLSEYILFKILDLKVDLTINERYFPRQLTPAENAIIIGIRGYQGTGKTEWMARKIQPLLNRGERVIVIVHREQLAVALAERFGICYRTEIYKSPLGNLFGYSLCIDSLHAKANPPFIGDSDYWHGATVVIDEVEQVLWHALNGSTCQQHRINILKTLKALLQKVASTGGKIYIADANLSNIAVSYVKALIGWNVPTWVVDNTYNPVTNGERTLFWYRGKNPSGLLKKAEQFLKDNKKILFFTDGQKYKSEYGTVNLEQYFKKKFPNLKILRIDSKSLTTKDHPSVGCIPVINDILPHYDLVICSPTLETGISITCGHFDEVFCISHGVQTVEAVQQSLERERSHIPRHIWCIERSFNSIGNGSIELKSLLNGTKLLSSAHIKQLQIVGINEFDGIRFLEEDEENLQTPSLWAWVKRACIMNYQSSNFAKCLEKNLLKSGYRILEGDAEDEETDFLIHENKMENYSNHRQAVSDTPNPSNSKYERLKETKLKTEIEELEEQKGKLCRRYLTDNIDPELIEKDDDGWYSKLMVHYYLTMGNEFLVEHDRQALGKLYENGEGTVFRPDVNKKLIGKKIEVLKWLGVEKFLDRDAEFTSRGLQEEFDRINTAQIRYQLKIILGITLSPKDTPIGFYQRLLEQMFGLQLRFDRWETVDKKSYRVYKGCDVNGDRRMAVLRRYLNRDVAIRDNVAVA